MIFLLKNWSFIWIAILLLAVGGWISNIVKLALHGDLFLHSGMTIARVVGILSHRSALFSGSVNGRRG